MKHVHEYRCACGEDLPLETSLEALRNERDSLLLKLEALEEELLPELEKLRRENEQLALRALRAEERLGSPPDPARYAHTESADGPRAAAKSAIRAAMAAERSRKPT